MKKIVLASNSPQRARLLEKIVPQFEISVSGVEEVDENSGLSFEAIAMLNAKIKAKAVLDRYTSMGQNVVVIGADTIVATPNEDRLLGKPKDIEEARSHLAAISGRSHRVITGIYIADKYKNVMESVTSTVFMKKLSKEEIDDYVADGHTLDKSGGFDIDELLDKGLALKIEGSLDNIIGLPTERLKVLLSNF